MTCVLGNQFLDGEIPIRVDADVGRNVECALGDAAGVELGGLQHRPGGGERELAAGADRGRIDVGLDHITVARDHEELVRIADEQQRLEAPQVAVRAPILRELDGGAGEIAVFLELAKDWRSDRYLRRLEALLLVGDPQKLFVISGNGDVIEPEYDVAAIGSGGQYALAAARALLEASELDARSIVERSLNIAADVCIYTNRNILIEELRKSAGA